MTALTFENGHAHCGDLLQRGRSCLLHLLYDRQHRACEALGHLTGLTTAAANGIEVRVAQFYTACLGSRQRRLSTLRDQRALLLCQSRVNVEHKRIGVATQRRDDEGHLVGNQACDEADVASQAIELGNDDCALQLRSYCKGLAKLWAALQGVAALAGLDSTDSRAISKPSAAANYAMVAR